MEDKPHVILVDDQDIAIGTMEKLEAHQKGLLHRCFSIFVFNKEGKMLLQRRAIDKYHCGGMWSNTCCSHQQQNVPEDETIHQRLKEEMGFDCKLQKTFTYTYKASFPNGLTEHEIDHVFIGEYDGAINPNPREVDAYEWVDAKNLPQKEYTPWFKLLLPKVLEERKKLKEKEMLNNND